MKYFNGSEWECLASLLRTPPEQREGLNRSRIVDGLVNKDAKALAVAIINREVPTHLHQAYLQVRVLAPEAIL